MNYLEELLSGFLPEIFPVLLPESLTVGFPKFLQHFLQKVSVNFLPEISTGVSFMILNVIVRFLLMFDPKFLSRFLTGFILEDFFRSCFRNVSQCFFLNNAMLPPKILYGIPPDCLLGSSAEAFADVSYEALLSEIFCHIFFVAVFRIFCSNPPEICLRVFPGNTPRVFFCQNSYRKLSQDSNVLVGIFLIVALGFCRGFTGIVLKIPPDKPTKFLIKNS